jgi:uncharacterized protein DUF4352
MLVRFRMAAGAVLLAAGCLAGCHRATSTQIDYTMGEKVPIGPLTYNVVESTWKTQMGQIFKLRIPQQRFLLIRLSVTNGGGSEVSVPLLQLENSNGQTFMESENGEGVDNWFGILRNLAPTETQQGRIVFDVPLTSYRLRVTDGAGPGAEKYAWISIPLSLDVDSAPTPVPGPDVR